MNLMFKKSQILMLFLLAASLAVTPFLSSSLRPTYFYFIFNLLMIALAIEAGFLSVLSKPLEEKWPAFSVATKPFLTEAAAAAQEPSAETKASFVEFIEKAAPKVVQKVVTSMPSLFFNGGGESEAEEPSAETKASFIEFIEKAAPKVVKKVVTSMPSLFFIGGGESEAEEAAAEEEEFEGEEEEEEEEEEEVMVLSKQELFTQTETFIGNFYKQLKMQRVESSKKTHGFYQKAF